MEKEKILEKINLDKGFGYALNTIQDVACEHLPEKSVNRFLTAANKDADMCEGMDCIILNGRMFDWKEFELKVEEIVLAYLDYFTDEEIETIYKNL